MELEEAQNSLSEKLNREASIEPGPYTCANVNLSLVIWENSEFNGAGWSRQHTPGGIL